jgi:peroxiredoxin Q/BCP
MVSEGDVAPPLCLPNQDGEGVCLTDLKGTWLVVYFYPKDGTAGCTREAQDFSAYREAFEALGTKVLGVSPDPPEKHRAFIAKNGLSLELLSDSEPGHEALKAYGVWQRKKMYGREYYGVVRSTAVIGPDGFIRRWWTKVKVPGHAEEVLSAVRELSAG